MTSLWQVVTILCVASSVLCTNHLKYRRISDPFRVCLATYSKRLNHEVLIGRWHYVYKFATLLNLPSSSSCREVLFEKPTEQDLSMYKDFFNSTGMPYSFDEDSVLYSESSSEYPSNFHDGLFLGGREAKFFLRLPELNRDRETYYVKVLRHINDDYLVHEDCSLRGNIKWLISKKKHPSDEELQHLINSQRDLKAMEKQKFCEFEDD